MSNSGASAGWLPFGGDRDGYEYSALGAGYAQIGGYDRVGYEIS